MNGFRYANIGLVVAISIVVAGIFLFKDSSEGAMQAMVLVGFVIGSFVYHYLDERAKKRRKAGVQ